ncbi:DUF4256 domain-containing protein [Mucilaginibacter pallidiroseus]|nr:DUF4256 domain-containing protein [Mucilaginibacter pallidiroseus]
MKLSATQSQDLLEILKNRFLKNMDRHPGLDWADVETRLKDNEEKQWSLNEMEITGGEPDVVAFDDKTDEYTFFDCSAETPAGRRSTCYDREGWESRKDNRPENTAVDMAEEMGVQLLNEEQYRYLQQLGKFDLKTSSWLATAVEIRKLGGAIFADRRYNTVFVYHNGAQSYYAGRAFRAALKVR